MIFKDNNQQKVNLIKSSLFVFDLFLDFFNQKRSSDLALRTSLAKNILLFLFINFITERNRIFLSNLSNTMHVWYQYFWNRYGTISVLIVFQDSCNCPTNG